MSNTNLSSSVSISPSVVDVALRDGRVDTIQTFTALTTPQQEQLANDAWHVGLRALMNAYKQAEEARLEDIGRTMAEDLDEQLRSHAEQQEKTLTKALERYFNPESGELGARLRQFVGNEGVLVTLLQKHLGPQNSVLVETLAQHIGDRSPLFRLLSPTDSQGLVSVLAERMRTVLQQEHTEFQKAMDPLREDGAVGHFITRLRDELKKTETDQEQQLKVALAALDTTREDSLLNQLRRETQQARAELLRAINPAVEDSPLAAIRVALTAALSEHAKSQKEQLEESRKQAAEFQRDVRDAVTRIEARRREEKTAVRGGGVFEDAVSDFIQRQLGAYSYLIDPTGNVVGLRPNCKVGDLVIRFPVEHLFSQSKIVVESKRDRSYTVSRALDEIATARKNRDACAGIFVLARSHAAPGFQTFARFGQDVIVVWDDEDRSTDPYLQAALMVGLALATRSRNDADQGDLQALRQIEERLVKELERLGDIKKRAENIRKNAEAIEKEVDVGQSKLGRIVGDAQKTLAALNVQLTDYQAERGCPIQLTTALPGNASQQTGEVDPGALTVSPA